MSTYNLECVPVVLEKHENADKLSVVRIKGWQVCTETTQWKEGDTGIYITPDSLVPISRPEFAFLVKDAKDYGTKESPKMMARIKAKKLRGVVSYGLLVPNLIGATPGTSLALEALGVEHYDPETTKTQKDRNKINLGGETEKEPSLPYPPSYYDIENLQSHPDWLEVGEEVLLTEKLDGSNMVVTWWDGRFWIKSRQFWKREYPSYSHLSEEGLITQGCSPEKAKEILERLNSQPKKENEFWQVFRRVEDSVGKYCRDNPGVCVIGELFGRQGKIKYLPANTFRAFDILREGEWVDPLEAREIQIPWVPIVSKIPYSLEEVLKASEGQSFIDLSCIREGVVVSPIKERRNYRGSRVKLKCVNPVYHERY